MKSRKLNICVLLVAFIACTSLYAQQPDSLAGVKTNDSITKKERKKLLKEEERNLLRLSHKRFGIRVAYVYAFLDTEVSFELEKRNLNSTISLENNLGLPTNSVFFTGSFLYRITPRSGIYAQYYGINRSEHCETQEDLIFRRDTIPTGTELKAYFNTQVISAGYMYSILKDPNAFLGIYFNVYFMFIETGIKSDLGVTDATVRLAAPLPNIGIIASFRLTKWLNLNAGVGFFALHTKDFGGSIYNFNISLMTKPVKWLGVSLSYQEFDVRVEFPSDQINTVVDYNFRGPALGLSFIF